MFEYLNNLFQQSPLMQGGVVLMLAGWLGYQLRELPLRVLSQAREWTTRVIEIRDTHPHYDAWLSMLTEHAVRRGGPRTLEVRQVRHADESTSAGSVLAAGTDDFFARVCGRWCHVNVYREKGSAGQPALVDRFIVTVEVLFGTSADLQRMSAAAASRANVLQHRQLVHVFDRYSNRTTLTLPRRSPESLCLPRELFDAIAQRLEQFCLAKEQYERVGLPWRMGLLLSGEPGTGKTSLAHALATHLGLPIVVISIADLESDQELLGAFRNIVDQAVVLIEDVDCAFRQRTGEDAEGVSFSGFLNCIDGVLAPHNGRILIMSTNHVDRLDPALVRPGRVDLHFELPTLDRQSATDYVDRIFPNVARRHEIVDALLKSERPTPATLINRITQERWHRASPSETAVLPLSAGREIGPALGRH